MSEPDFRVLNTGNNSDDDPAVMDALFETVTSAPVPEDLPISSPDVAPIKPKKANRLLTGTMSVGKTWDAVLILPEDARRDGLTIRAIGTGTDYIRIADDPGKLATDFAAGRLYTGADLSPSGYTGPVWIAPASNAANSADVLVSWWGVTE